MLTVTVNCIINNNVSNNIGATTARCVHGSGAWTGRNLFVDEELLKTTGLEFGLFEGKASWP